jgi:hypothetical protein
MSTVNEAAIAKLAFLLVGQKPETIAKSLQDMTNQAYFKRLRGGYSDEEAAELAFDFLGRTVAALNAMVHNRS